MIRWLPVNFDLFTELIAAKQLLESTGAGFVRGENFCELGPWWEHRRARLIEFYQPLLKGDCHSMRPVDRIEFFHHAVDMKLYDPL